MSIYSGKVDYRTFSLRGTHYTMGHTLGKVTPLFIPPQWWSPPPPLDFADACAREIALIHPSLLEEIQGYADGQAQDYHDIFRLMCRQRLSNRLPPERGGCTSFAWRTSDGQIIVGRNYDFHPLQRIRQRIRAVPEDGFATVGMRGTIPVGCYDGVNSAGLFVSLHVVICDRPDQATPGVPFHLIPRLVLETCANVPEALHLLTMIPHLHSFNYLVADSETFAAVETHADRVRVVHPDGNLLVVSNLYQHPQMLPLMGKRKSSLPRQKVEFLHHYLLNSEGDSWETAKSALRDCTVPICGITGEHTTLWSCLANLPERRLTYASGNPLEVDYEDVAWA